jgi:hypothetical protein
MKTQEENFESKFWRTVFNHSHSADVRRYLELRDHEKVRRWYELSESKIIQEYLQVLNSPGVVAFLEELGRQSQSEESEPLPAADVTEEEISNFDFPVLVNCGHDPKIHSIVLELNKRNQNPSGYGHCLRCNGYHSNEYSKEFCLKNESN